MDERTIEVNFEDRRLVKRLLSGDEEAFEFFIDEYYPRIHRFAASRLLNERELVDDVVQNVFRHAIEGLERYRGEAALFTWLCSICRYKIYELLRSRGRERTVDIGADDPEIRGALESLARLEMDAFDRIEKEELASLVRAVLDHLPIHYEKALRWKYVDDLSTREIATNLNVSSKAAESLLTRARSAFRDGFGTTMEVLHD